MGKKHKRSENRRYGMSIAEAVLAMQAGRWAGAQAEHRRRHERRREEAMSSDALQLVILKLIAEEPRRGDELIGAIAKLTDGGYEPGPEIVYPTLEFLRDSGLIEAVASKKEGTRYQITDAGNAELEERSDEVEPLMRRKGKVERMDGSEERQAVKNAMRNLAGAMAQRMVSKGVDDELLREVADIIDEAAGRINKL